MIDTEQQVTIGTAIDRVWDHASDIRRWAALMPGLQDCEIIDADDSRWTLKVGAGALVRRVRVDVHVDRWAGPERVDFSYALAGDPVRGGGFYAARALGANATEVTLSVFVEGTGPMAPMWEAMGKPLLPKFAQGFADQLKAAIEAGAGAPAPVARRPRIVAVMLGWIRKWFGKTGEVA